MSFSHKHSPPVAGSRFVVPKMVRAALAASQQAYAGSWPESARQGEIINLNFSSTFGKAREATSICPGVLQGGKVYKLRNSVTGGSKKHGEGIATEGLRKPQNP